MSFDAPVPNAWHQRDRRSFCSEDFKRISLWYQLLQQKLYRSLSPKTAARVRNPRQLIFKPFFAPPIAVR
jgi:hypothetical protein